LSPVDGEAAGYRDVSATEITEMYEPDRVRSLERPHGLPFRIGKLGHVVLNVRDVEQSARFYTEILGF
jgi:catechol-2,3-dioxygenase